ncbi:hypothetical protein LWC33_33605 [Pseudonocardia sp. RS11V-5]|uniref:hypothetical protein n=1 Tax=Pseudonocardia terrae TaxID=2905831 RepID=UPI001E338B02|nr:hypothetical protein [Pseudonocardia terrae]MCE3556366.1 hypothetical protein [Pseudonocardia terrae]
MSRTTSTALRLVAAGALGLPLTLGVAGVANAAPAHGGSSGCADEGHSGGGHSDGGQHGGGHSGGGHSGGGHSGGGHSGGGHSGGGHGGHGSDGGRQIAYQGGSLVGALAQVNPALNIGGILNSGDVHQVAGSANSANSGIEQSRGWGGPGSGGQQSFQAGDVVSALLQVDPAVNVGGILNSGDVRQTAVTGNSANSGIVQDGGHGGGHGGGQDGGHGGGHGSSRSGGQHAAQGGDLIGLDLQLNPAVNIGGILNSGDVRQTAVTENSANSGISQHR